MASDENCQMHNIQGAPLYPHAAPCLYGTFFDLSNIVLHVAAFKWQLAYAAGLPLMCDSGPHSHYL